MSLDRSQTDRAWLLAHDTDELPSSSGFCSCASGAPTREPLAYIVGHKEFFGLKLLV
jgi:release factor glutamine methyltransferase